MKCKRCGGSGRYRILSSEGPSIHYCYCAAGDAQRARDEVANTLAPNTPRPLAKAKPRARKRPRKAGPRVAAKAPKKKRTGQS